MAPESFDLRNNAFPKTKYKTEERKEEKKNSYKNSKNTEIYVVQWLRQLVACMSLQRDGFQTRRVYLGFVVENVALEQDILRVLLVSHYTFFT